MKLENLDKQFDQKVVTTEVNTQQLDEDRRIVCDSKTLQGFITEFVEGQCWKYEDAAKFFELAGLETPIKVSNYDSSKSCFDCCTANGKKYLVSLFLGHTFGSCSDIFIEDEKEVREYSISSRMFNPKAIPKVELESIRLKRGKKYLEKYYNTCASTKKVKVDDNHLLFIKASGIENSANKNVVDLLYKPEVEEFLLSLQDSKDIVNKVVNKLFIEMLGLSKEELQKGSHFEISYGDYYKSNYRDRIKIVYENGLKKEEAILVGDETFHIRLNLSDIEYSEWEYVYKTIQICGLIGEGYSGIDIYGGKKELATINLDETLDKAWKGNSNLMATLKESLHKAAKKYYCNNSTNN